ncbi:MAG TPA: hypothetical protein VMT30_09010 [Candidatus Saccharimonadia bacterium]|nr:hypothetical protein [Candidatus Saccharimonadia bacterium]
MGTQAVQSVGRLSSYLLRRRLPRQLHALRVCERRLSLDAVPSVGLEIELHLVNEHGRPYFGLAPLILEQLRARSITNVVPELASCQLELNLTPQPLLGRGLTRMYQEAERLLDTIVELAAAEGAFVVLIGILPTMGADQLVPGHRSSGGRYAVLQKALWQDREPVSAELNDPDGQRYEFCSTSVDTLMPNSSVQPHFYFPGLGTIVPAHNLAVATAGPIMAVTANAPLPFGGASGQDLRHRLFHLAVGPERCRVNNYITDPNEPIRCATELPPILYRPDRERSLSKAQRGILPDLDSLALAVGTSWPIIDRIVADTRGRHLRHELRHLSSGPTLADIFAALVLVGGLMANPFAADYTGPLEPHAEANFESACRHDANEPLIWPDASGRLDTRHAHDIVRHDLLPRTREGWMLWGVASDEVEQFLEPIARRVARGSQALTGAGWQLARRTHYLQGGHPAAEATRLMLLDYIEHSRGGLGHSVSYWPDPSASQLRPISDTPALMA